MDTNNVEKINTDKKRSRASAILVFVLIAASFAVTGVYALSAKNKTPELYLYVQADADVVLRAPIREDALYMIMDGVATAVEEGTTLESLGEDGLASKHDVNFVQIKDGVVTCTESNCDNQVCVFTPAISGDDYDLPIVCLPHQLILQIKN